MELLKVPLVVGLHVDVWGAGEDHGVIGLQLEEEEIRIWKL